MINFSRRILTQVENCIPENSKVAKLWIYWCGKDFRKNLNILAYQNIYADLSEYLCWGKTKNLMSLENCVRNYERNMFHSLYHTFCVKGAEVANKHTIIKICSLWSRGWHFWKKNIKQKLLILARANSQFTS